MGTFSDPVANALGQLTCDVSTITLDGSGSSGTGTIIFEWQDANTTILGDTPQIDVGSVGTYTLIVTDTENNCSAQTTVDVLGDPEIPVADASVTGIIDCQNADVLLSGAGSTGTGNLNI